MPGKTIDELHAESRLIAKTINRLVIEPDKVDMNYWKYEAKLLGSDVGACLSSTTLLVQGAHVPTYGIDSRSYGFLFDANKCNIYDVHATDANTERAKKLKARKERKGIDFLTSNEEGFLTLDQLSQQIKDRHPSGQLNEVLLDATTESCVGLFVRMPPQDVTNPAAEKQFVLAQLGVRLVQKYLIQAFGFPDSFPIVQYSERDGRMHPFPTDAELLRKARLNGITDRTHPRLLEMLKPEFSWERIAKPITIEAYLNKHELDASQREKILVELASEYETLDGRKFDSSSIQKILVDDTTGVPTSTIDDIIEKYTEKLSADQSPPDDDSDKENIIRVRR